MKINGEGQPPVPGATGADGAPQGEALGSLDKPGAAKTSSATGGPEHKTFAETIAGPGAARTAPAAAPGDPAVRALAAALDAGQLDPRAAVDRLIEHVIDLQLGSGASPQARDQVAAALRAAIDSDPLIAAKLKQLG